jgi:starch synthase
LVAFHGARIGVYDGINPLKAGLVFSDALTTVSPQYAREIQSPQFGEGLDGVLRDRSVALAGILNGIDYTQWNPGTDAIIASNYSADDMSGKAACRRDLLQGVGLPDDPTKPIIGMVSRLSSQKGFDLVAQALEPMLAMGFQLVLLGTGDQYYQRLFEDLGRRFPHAVSVNLGVFNDDLAHRIYAGSDFFLMPSRYEPCGLGQMIALAYGTVPVVRATGAWPTRCASLTRRRGRATVSLSKSSARKRCSMRCGAPGVALTHRSGRACCKMLSTATSPGIFRRRNTKASIGEYSG